MSGLPPGSKAPKCHQADPHLYGSTRISQLSLVHLSSSAEANAALCEVDPILRTT